MSSDSGERRPGRMTGTAGGQKSTEPENLPCPRCDSTNTKFCYYNNYNLSQPRHFCKSCRRYWTRGGTLRNVPVGGGTRKASSNKRPRTTTLAAASPPEMPREAFHSAGSGCEVNLNEAVPDPGTATFTSLLGCPVAGDGAGFMSLGGFGLGLGEAGMHGFGFGLGMVDWPEETVGAAPSGNVNGGGPTVGGPVGSSSCNTWQMGGGLVDGSLDGTGDYFGWPDLAISAPGRRS